MRTLTFILDTQTGDDGMAPITITIVEQGDGTLLFTLSNDQDTDGQIADIRGLFFDVADDSLLGSLNFAGSEITQIVQNGSVSNLGGGVTTSGVPDSPYEVGVEFGTPGMSTDDYQTVSFVLSADRPLTIDDIALEHMAVRQTSVSSADGGREDSDKLYGDAPYPVDAIDDAADVLEDETASGNVFANDVDKDAGDADGNGIPDGLTVTDVNGDAGTVGTPIELAPGVTVTVNADGSYSVDATDADWMAEGETFTADVTYGVSDGNGGSDSATLTVTVTGVNDTPDALDDAGATDEATVTSGNVLANDSDPDLSDVLTVSAVNGDSAAVGQQVLLDSGALLTLNADGTYSYDPNGAFDSLNDGETASDSFTYQVSDGHGGFDTATVTLTIEGIGGGDTGPEDDADHFGTFSNKKGTADHDISNVVLYLDDGTGDVLKVKIDGWSGETDLDNVDLGSFMENYGYDDYELLAVSIKAGNNHNRDLGPGEGQLFLLDGDEDIDYAQGGDVPDGLTLAILGAKADETYQYSTDLFE
ncbi:Ig-like domain-containing protein [Kordiimonas lipolytica]|uniref:Ig-like domain-containing protein n=1 Tax=Kordiimonas lipolytica TaxID=1662421 RepID=A0ABV8UF85_9PROT|nr:Ig-like domain-containing protein [Kordiimonas lipolytica]